MKSLTQSQTQLGKDIEGSQLDSELLSARLQDENVLPWRLYVFRQPAARLCCVCKWGPAGQIFWTWTYPKVSVLVQPCNSFAEHECGANCGRAELLGMDVFLCSLPCSFAAFMVGGIIVPAAAGQSFWT